MVERAQLLAAVASAFEETGAAFPGWPDPHDGGGPTDEEYSRVTNPGRWLILGARADDWLDAFVQLGLATVERDAQVVWERTPGPTISRVDRAVPRAAGALPLVVARSHLGGVVDAGVTIGVGDPTACVAWFPDCGCDACDDGSRLEVERLDEYVVGVVTGTYRRLRRGEREIEVVDQSGWSARGLRGRDDVSAILRDPSGWDELIGRSWLDRSPHG